MTAELADTVPVDDHLLEDLFLLHWMERHNLSSERRIVRMFLRDHPKARKEPDAIRLSLGRLKERGFVEAAGGAVKTTYRSGRRGEIVPDALNTLEGVAARCARDPATLEALLGELRRFIEVHETTVSTNADGSTVVRTVVGDAVALHRVDKLGRLTSDELLPAHHETRLIERQGRGFPMQVREAEVKDLLRKVDRRLVVDNAIVDAARRGLQRPLGNASRHQAAVFALLDVEVCDLVQATQKALWQTGRTVTGEIDRIQGDRPRDLYDWLAQSDPDVRATRMTAVRFLPDALQIIVEEGDAIDAGEAPAAVIARRIGVAGATSEQIEAVSRRLALPDEERSKWSPHRRIAALAYLAGMADLDRFPSISSAADLGRKIASLACGRILADEDYPKIRALFDRNTPETIESVLSTFRTLQSVLSWTYVIDPLDALETVLSAPDSITRLAGGSGRPEQVRDIVDGLCRYMGEFEQPLEGVLDNGETITSLDLNGLIAAGFDPAGERTISSIRSLNLGSIPFLVKTEGPRSFRCIAFVSGHRSRFHRPAIIGYDLERKCAIEFTDKLYDSLSTFVERDRWPASHGYHPTGARKDLAVRLLAPWTGPDFARRVRIVAEDVDSPALGAPWWN